MSLTTFSDIPRSTLALLLDREGEALGISPRLMMGEAGTLDRQQIAELYAGGFIESPDKRAITLTPQFVRVASVLLDPHTNVTMRNWGQDGSRRANIHFPTDIMQGSGVMLNQRGGMYRISAFVDDSTVAGMLGEAIPQPEEQDLQFDIKAQLDNAMAAILFAVIDLARIRVSKAENPEPALNMVFSTQEVYSYMYDRWTPTDFKGLITCITAAGIMPEAPSLTGTVDGLRALVESGILKGIKADSYGLTKASEPLVGLTIGPLSGMQWQRVSLMDSGEQIVSSRMFLFADESLMLCLAPTAEGQLLISRVRRQEITDFLAEEILTTLTPADQSAADPQAEAAPEPSIAAQKAPSAPPKLPKSAPPPSAPGVAAKAVPRAQTFCVKCGADLRPGAKFCKKCGTVVSPKQSPPSETACANCGKPIKPGAKFCAGCGTRI